WRTTRAIPPRRTQPCPGSCGDPTGWRPRPKASRSASDHVASVFTRGSRLVANAWRSGDLSLAMEAMRFHCQEPLNEFLRAGGRVAQDAVEYGGLNLDRSPFAGANLAGVPYLRRYVDLVDESSTRTPFTS